MNNKTTQEQNNQNYQRVKVKIDFYTDHIKNYATLVVLCTLLLSFLIYSVLVTYWDRPKDKYFAGYRDGSIIKLIPLDQQFFFDSEVSSWASVVLMQLLNFDFLNYAENIKQQSSHLNDNGLNSFISWFQKDLLSNMVENRFVLSTHLCGIAEVINKGLNQDKIFSWDINFPIVMIFQNSAKKKILTAVVSMNLVRVPNTESFDGVHINNISVSNLELASINKGRKNCPTSPSYS